MMDIDSLETEVDAKNFGLSSQVQEFRAKIFRDIKDRIQTLVFGRTKKVEEMIERISAITLNYSARKLYKVLHTLSRERA